MKIKECQVPFMDYQVYAGSLHDLPPFQRLVINTINQYSLCVAEKDSTFKKALIQSDILLPDGVGITAAVKFLTGHKIKKIAGADLFQYMMNHLNATGGKCFFLGSSPETLGRIEKRLLQEFPAVTAGFYSPPFTPALTREDNQKMIDVVNAFNPEVLFVGMTAPKQEKWVFEHKDQLKARVFCSIGAVFDFYAGTVDRPNQFWVNLGLEWLIRLSKEPRRMWRRYLYYGPVFLYHIYKQKRKLQREST